jgi:hypothetical protein
MHIFAEIGVGVAWDGRMRKIVVVVADWLVKQAELQRWRRKSLHWFSRGPSALYGRCEGDGGSV